MRREWKDDGWRIPDELWTKIAPLLPQPLETHPWGVHRPRVDNRTAMAGIFFVLRTGCQWNALNATGICSSSSAHRRFQEWEAAGVFQEIWAWGLEIYDALVGIEWRWQALDGAMHKAPLGGKKSGPNPTDRGKTGTKESLLVDGRGVPLGAVVAGAKVNDYKLLEATLASSPIPRPDPRVPDSPAAGTEQGLCLDADYFRVEIYETLERRGYTAHIRPIGRGSGARDLTLAEAHELQILARRWIVERTHSWLHQYRGLLIRWCKKGRNYLALLHFACGLIAFKASGLLG